VFAVFELEDIEDAIFSSKGFTPLDCKNSSNQYIPSSTKKQYLVTFKKKIAKSLPASLPTLK
jgi:hypothetical protein